MTFLALIWLSLVPGLLDNDRLWPTVAQQGYFFKIHLEAAWGEKGQDLLEAPEFYSEELCTAMD